MLYFKRELNKKLMRITSKAVWVVRALPVLFSSVLIVIASTAHASLIVIGNQDIKINQLNPIQLSALFLNKSVSLATGETLSPIDQDPNSAIYAAFYQHVAGMDTSSVNSYWSGLTFSGTGTRSAQVDSDRSAIASVEQNSKAIAYIDSASLGTQMNHVKILYGRLSDEERRAAEQQEQQQEQQQRAQEHAAEQPTTLPLHGTTAQLRQTLSQEITQLRAQQQQYQQLNEERELQLLQILKAEQAIQKKYPDAIAAISASPKFEMIAGAQDLWMAMRSHFALNDDGHSQAVNKQLAWYLSHRWVVNMIIKNSEPYIGYAYQEVEKRGMPAEFALLPMIESGYVPFAVSSAGASGLWQLMPNTASSSGIKMNWWYDGRLDIVRSTHMALNFLVELNNSLHGWPLACAAYNAGEGTVSSAINYNSTRGLPTDYWSLPLPQETKDYYPKLLAMAEIIANPAKYGFTLPPLTTEPNFATVKLSSQIDRSQIADLANTSEEAIHQLNPGMLRWATDPQGSYTLAIPTDQLSTFKINLARLANQKRLLWSYYNVNNASLADIALSHHTTVSELMAINQLPTTTIENGQGLIVPTLSNSTYADLNATVEESSLQAQIAMQLSQAQVQPLPAQMPVATPAQQVPQASQQIKQPADPVVDRITANNLLRNTPAAVSSTSVASTSVQSVPAATPQLAQPQSDNPDPHLKALMQKLYE